MTTYADQFPGMPPPDPPRRRNSHSLDPRRGLPRLPVFWTLDQIAASLGMSEEKLRGSYLWFDGRDTGAYRKRYLRAVNIARGRHDRVQGGHPFEDWRVAEGELIRWLTYHRLWVYDPTSITFDAPLSLAQQADLRRSEQDDKVFVRETRGPSRRHSDD